MKRFTLLMLVTALAACAGTSQDVMEPKSSAESDRLIFENVRVIPMTGDEDILIARVVVDKSEIVLVTSMDQPAGEFPGATVIDGDGQYLMPGLADMHVHYGNEDEGILYIANSTTTVRAPWGTQVQFRLDSRAKHRALIGPHVYASGPIMDGPEPLWGAGSMKITSAEVAEGAIEAQRASGFKAIKLYEGISEPVFRAAVAAAKDRNMQVWTHTPEDMTTDQVLELGVDSLEHMDDFQDLLVPDDFETDESRGISFRRWKAADPEKMKLWAEFTAKSGVWSAPTFNVLSERFKYVGDSKAFFDRPDMAYVNPGIKMWWASYADQMTPFQSDAHEAGVKQRQFVKALFDAGARLLIGTDNPNPFVIPGFAIHDELNAFLESGIPAARVLNIATAEAAEFLREKGEFGVVAVGARADLVLLDADPRENMETLRDPAGVLMNGRWIPRAEIRAELDALEQRMNEV